MDLNISKNIQIRLNSMVDYSNNDIKDLLLECNKIQNNILGHTIFTQIIQAIKRSGQTIQFMDQDHVEIIKSCTSLTILGCLYNQELIQIKNKEKELRETIRNLINKIQQQCNLEKAFLIQEAIICKTKEEHEKISTIIKQIVNVLIDFGSDSFHFKQIFDVIIKALLLTGNIRTIAKDHQLLQILDKLAILLKQITSYQWIIVMEQVLNASTYKEKSTDLIQPNLIARIILQQTPLIVDQINSFGKYFGRCYEFEYEMFQSMLNYGLTQRSLDLILKLSKYFVEVFQIDILIKMRNNLIPKLIQQMKNLICFDQIQNLFNYFLISSHQQLDDLQLDNQYLNQIIQKYYENFEMYNQQQLQRIANFVELLPKNINKKDIQNYQMLESKLIQKQIIFQQKSIAQLQMIEQIQFWFDQQQQQNIQTPKQFVGLKNQLNTCYLNSFIQALFWSLDFRDLIINKFKREKVQFLKPFSLKTNFLRCFLYLDSIHENIDYNPLLLKRSLREPYRTDNRQQDAAEFGVHLFEDMESNFEPEEYKQIKDIFYGISKSTFQCKNCEKLTKGPDEEFMYITLNFENDRQAQEDIEGMISKHQINEQITFKCDSCKKTSLSTRSLEFSKLPKNLIIQINRFEFQQGNRSKINDQINIKSIIQITESQKSFKYELYSIIIHFGQIPDTGHYTAYCKVIEDWYKFDDSIVSKIDRDFEKVQRNFKKEETPYLLFFRRKNG